MKKNKTTASKLKVILIAGALPLIGLSAYAASSLFTALEEKSKKALHARIDSEVSADNEDNLKRLKARLENSKEDIEKTSLVVSESRMYMYQNQIINDINTYAAAAGVLVSEYNFEDSSPENNSSPSSTNPGSSSQQEGEGSASTLQKSTVPGLKSVSSAITLKGPTPVRNFLIFLKYIEQNITKMQVTGVSLKPATESPDLLSDTTINVTVYTR